MSESNGAVAITEREQMLTEQLGQYADTLDLFQERIAELELAQDDVGWQRLGGDSGNEFSREFLRKITAVSRLMFLKNPLINRAVTLQAYYVFGQGIAVQATHESVNDVVQAFMDDRQNQAELTSHQARTMKEQTLQTEGNLFFVLFTNGVTGRVKVRTIPVDEVAEIVTNPDDAREPWYYKRTWTQQRIDLQSGTPTIESRTAYYPDWRYRPSAKPSTIGGASVEWATPVYHVRVGGLDGMRFGVPETYASLDWAKAYKSFLEDWATITRALARFAFKVTTPGGARGVAAARTRLNSTIGTADGAERNPPPGAGATFVAAAGSGADLTPIKTAGATTSAEDGRRMLLMVAAATGLPESFFGDVSVGTLATAKSLDRPTELKFRDRQTLWADIHQDLVQFVIDQAVTAPRGPLSGTVTLDDEGERVIVLADDPETGEPIDRHVAIEFPPILEHSVTETIDALVSGMTLDGKTLVLDSPEMAELVMRQVLQALSVKDADEVLAKLFPRDAQGALLPLPKPEPPAPPQPEDGTTLPTDQPSAAQTPAEAMEARGRVVGALTEAGYPIESALVLAGHNEAEVRTVLEAKQRQIERDQLLAREDVMPEVEP